MRVGLSTSTSLVLTCQEHDEDKKILCQIESYPIEKYIGGLKVSIDYLLFRSVQKGEPLCCSYGYFESDIP